MEPHYENRLMVARQSQFDVTQDVNRLVSGNRVAYGLEGAAEWLSVSVVGIVRDRVAEQVRLYTGGVQHPDTDVSVLIGMILQFPQDETQHLAG
jgi:hypothetical protein